jgi:hypothetical protein
VELPELRPNSLQHFLSLNSLCPKVPDRSKGWGRFVVSKGPRQEQGLGWVGCVQRSQIGARAEVGLLCPRAPDRSLL